MTSVNHARLVLILGSGFVFLYFGIDKFVHPLLWTGWLPLWMDGLAGLPKASWLQIIAAGEIVFGAMILIPVRLTQKAGAALATLHLIGIITQVGWNDIAVRDIGLAAMTLALWYLI